MGYTVEEAGELLGIPRPTLYRYLKEYSVPYHRRAGRISIPEESLGRIRRVRELRNEGLGIGAIKARLRDGDDAAGISRITEKLDRLSDAIEESQRSSGRPSDVVAHSSSQTLHVVLARQSVLLSAVYTLTEMVEELLVVNGLPRRTARDSPPNTFSPQISYGDLSPRRLRALEGGSGGVGYRPGPAERQAVITASGPRLRGDKFGTLARRRRRTALAVLFALLAVGILAWAAVYT